MRVIFTSYAINSATVCLALTMALIMCDETSRVFDKIVGFISEYMYIVFGPVLFTFCLFGLSHLPSLVTECKPHGVSDRLNLMDVVVLLSCTFLAGGILFIYSLGHTNILAEQHLNDEQSVFFQVFMNSLKSAKANYENEKRERYL